MLKRLVRASGPAGQQTSSLFQCVDAVFMDSRGAYNVLYLLR